jgi:hypothetical protein
MATSVIEVDRLGTILPPEQPEMGALFPPDLVTGIPIPAFLDQHISVALPELANRSLGDLFIAGAFRPAVAPHLLAAAGAPRLAQNDTMKRSAIKSTFGKRNRDG